MKHPQKQEGAVLFVVLMIVMVGTASALFSATTVSHEVRGTGFARQQMQTRYAARGALIGAMEWFDIFGPEAVRDIVQTRGATDAKLFTCTSTAPISCSRPCPTIFLTCSTETGSSEKAARAWFRLSPIAA